MVHSWDSTLRPRNNTHGHGTRGSRSHGSVRTATIAVHLTACATESSKTRTNTSGLDIQKKEAAMSAAQIHPRGDLMVGARATVVPCEERAQGRHVRAHRVGDVACLDMGRAAGVGPSGWSAAVETDLPTLRPRNSDASFVAQPAPVGFRP